MKLRTIGMAAVAALTLVSGRAEAQTAGGGWDTQYGILFTLPQVLGGRTGADVINDYDGLVGFQYNLGPQAGVRLGVNLLRNACGKTEYTDANNITYKNPGVCADILTFVDPEGNTLVFNSELGIDLSAEYLMRATTADVSPYFGGGVAISYDRRSLKGEVSQSDLTGKLEYNDSVTSFGFGLLGKVGLEWRVYKGIALFAEYQLSIPVVQRNSFKIEEKVTGFPTYDADGKSTDYFNISTGAAHGGQLGLVAFF